MHTMTVNHIDKQVDEAISRAGWKEIPACPFVTLRYGSLRCAFDFETIYEKACQKLSTETLKDISLGGSYDVLAADKVTRLCRFDECPALQQDPAVSSMKRSIHGSLANLDGIVTREFRESL